MAKSRKQVGERREEATGQEGGGGTVATPVSGGAPSPGDGYRIEQYDQNAAGAVSPANEHDPGWTPAVLQQAVDRLGAVGVAPVMLIVPVSNQEAKGYMASVLHARLNREQSRTLKQLQAALNAGHYRRANGQHVDKTGHAIQWLLDQLHIAINRPADRSQTTINPAEDYVGTGNGIPPQPSSMVAAAICQQIATTVQTVLESFVPMECDSAEWLKEHCEMAEVGEVRTVMIDQLPVGEFRLTTDATSVRYEFERYE